MYLLLGLVGLIAYYYMQTVERRRRTKALEALIAVRRDEQKLNFDWARKVSSQLSQERAEEIVSLPFDTLKEQLRTRKILPTEALKAFQRKALECTAKTNCVCLFVEDSLRVAQELDELAGKSDFDPPPFFGIPISFKECVAIKHMDSTIGYAQDLFKPSSKDANIVAQVLRLGGIPFVQTNLPQALLSFGCTNPVYGRTCNPVDTSRVPGGSSGGEAALIAGGGSPLGVGTDVGGSIRTPASFCGIAGFKPTSDRMSHVGMAGSVPGRQMLVVTEGPMAPTIDVCIDFLRTIWRDEKLLDDPFVPPVFWQDHLYTSTKALNIGFYTDDGNCPAPPAYERAVLETVALLKSQGHNLVPFRVPSAVHAFEIFVAAASGDGGSYLTKKLDQDIVPAECYLGSPINRLPVPFQRLITKMLPWPRIRGVLQAQPKNCQEMRKMYEYLEHYRYEFLDEFRRLNLDAIVCPAFGSIAPKHGKANDMIVATCYTSIFNIVDFCAGVVQVTKASADDDAGVESMPTSDRWASTIREQCRDSVGLPISVQIAAPPYREETCLRLLRDVEVVFSNK